MELPSTFLVSDISEETLLFRRRDTTVTYGQFRDDVACLVSALRKSQANEAVLYSEDNYEFAVGLLACLYAEMRVVLPGNLCENTRVRLQKPGAVFVHELEPGNTAAELHAVDSSRVPVVFYTSGSTGEPKRIERYFSNLEAELNMLEELFPEGEPVEVFSTVSFHHAYGIIFGLLLPLSRGIVSDTASFAGLSPWLARVDSLVSSGKQAWLVTTPAFLRIWADNTDLTPLLHRPVRLLSAGAPLPVAVADRVAAVTEADVYEIFGSSETGVTAYRQPLKTQIWQRFASVQLTLTEQGMEVISPAVPAGTSAKLGDSAELLADGRFRLLPRIDRVVKLADKRVSLTEVEKCLVESCLVKQAYALVPAYQRVARMAVAVVPDEAGMELLRQEGYAGFRKAMRAILAQQVEHTLLPRKWRIVGELPFNAQGKVTQAAVESMFSCSLQLPVMIPVFKSAEKLVVKLLYVKDSAYLAGHFPGYPIVPGVVILQSLNTLIQNYWGLLITGIERLKFTAETLPGHEQLITLTRKQDTVSVEILRNQDATKVVQGRLRVCTCQNPPMFLI